MDQDPFTNLSPEDSIEELGLSTRTFNALRRASISTVAELIQIHASGHISDIRGIGEKSLDELKDAIHHVQVIDAPHSADESNDAPSPDPHKESASSVDGPVDGYSAFSTEVVRWQAKLIEKQIALRLLHSQATVAGNSVAYWLSVAEIIDRRRAFEILASIIGGPHTICEELNYLLEGIPDNHFAVLLQRFGTEQRTLKAIGKDIGVSRERVRQIAVKLGEEIGGTIWTGFRREIFHDLEKPAFVRMQSALLRAKDMGLDITFNDWQHEIRSSGLVGDWIRRAQEAVDPVEAMLAVCNMVADSKVQELRIPENLQYATRLASLGSPDLPARRIVIRKSLPEDTKRLINRHARHSGGVHARWLSQEIGRSIADVEDILRALGYRSLTDYWFVQNVRSKSKNYKITRWDVFHHALRKMFQYCGPLPVDAVCSGIRNAVSKTRFPVPPPDVMGQILLTWGYACEERLYYWDGEYNEELSKSETVIMVCLEQHGVVVHHSELAQAFIDSELSFPSLHQTLSRSPLFDRIDTALYKLRGVSVSVEDITRAENAAERTPVDLELRYDKSGMIIVSVSLGILAVATGVVFSEQLPNLSGTWKCHIDDREFESLDATETELRHLKEVFEFLNCQVGDRVKFTFNTWKRSVKIEKVRS